MTSHIYIRLFALLLFATSLQTAFAQKKAATTKKSTTAKANTAPKAAPPAPVAAPIAPVAEPEYFPSDLLYLETGTPIFLETQNELDSKYLEEGKMVCLYVKYPVKVQGRTIIPAGREAYCRINRLVRPKGNGRAGILELEPMHIKTNDGQLVMLSGSPVSASGDDREILSQAISLGGSTVGQQMMSLYQQRQADRQMAIDAQMSYQQQQQLDQQQRSQEMAMQQQQIAMYQQQLQAQDLQSRQMQMMQQQQLMQQQQQLPRSKLVVMPIARQDVVMPAVDPRAMYANYSQPAPQQQQGSFNPAILGAAANPALLGVASALNIISPFISILIKGKRAKLPKGYTMKTCVGYGVVMDGSQKW